MAPRITWRDRLSARRMFSRRIEIEEWARAEVERTRPPVCDRSSCYDYDHPEAMNASRIQHGCVPDVDRADASAEVGRLASMTLAERLRENRFELFHLYGSECYGDPWNCPQHHDWDLRHGVSHADLSRLLEGNP